MADLSIMSFNCRGAMSAYPYITKCLSNTDIMFIQEHHLTPTTQDFLKSIHSEFNASIVISKVHALSKNSNLRQGGVAIL